MSPGAGRTSEWNIKAKRTPVVRSLRSLVESSLLCVVVVVGVFKKEASQKCLCSIIVMNVDGYTSQRSFNSCSD